MCREIVSTPFEKVVCIISLQMFVRGYRTIEVSIIFLKILVGGCSTNSIWSFPSSIFFYNSIDIGIDTSIINFTYKEYDMVVFFCNFKWFCYIHNMVIINMIEITKPHTYVLSWFPFRIFPWMEIKIKVIMIYPGYNIYLLIWFICIYSWTLSQIDISSSEVIQFFAIVITLWLSSGVSIYML